MALALVAMPVASAFAGPAAQVTLSATSGEVTYPSLVTLVAETTDKTQVAAQFQVKEVGQTDWSDILPPASFPGDTTGRFVGFYFPKMFASYRVVIGGVISPEVTVKVHTALSKPTASTTSGPVDTKFDFTGTIRPYHPVGAHPEEVKYFVYLERYSTALGGWKAYPGLPWEISGVVDNTTTQWAYNFAPSAQGKWRIRFFHECPRHTATYSPWREFSATPLPVTVGNPAAPSSAIKGAKTAITGTLKPRHKAGTSPIRIYKWRKLSTGTWKSYGYVLASVSDAGAVSKYKGTIAFPERGSWRVRAYHPADAKHPRAWSRAYDYVTVK